MGRIGSGGMGVVYRVEHVRLGKIAAMKVLHRETAADKDMVRRFWLEAQSVSRLNHPNIVQTFDFGTWDGALYLVMEYVAGEDLAAVIKREGPMPFARACRFFARVCSALTEAHDHGIVHRDLKPENLMVVRRRDGFEDAKVLDFGLAKLRERDESSAVTTGARVVGTPYYMSPEQVRGEALDGRADVYSLGATLYRVLTGVPPFQATTPMAVLTKHVTDEVVPPRTRAPGQDLPPEADQVVLRAMAKAPAERYQSAAEFQRELESILEGRSSQSDSRRSPSSRGLAGGQSQRAAGEAPTLSLSDSEVEDAAGNSAPQLRRSDIADFERQLRRRQLVTRVVLPLAAAGVIAVAIVLGLRFGTEKAETVEREPNNTPGYANLLPQETTVRGALGKALSGGQPDIDYYRIGAGKGPRVASARVEGVPGIDLLLELFDSQGRRLGKADAHGRGGGERLQPISIGSSDAYLAVREVWVQGVAPLERPDDHYSLTVRWGAPESGWEIEPNDWEASATPVTAGQTERGYLGDADDRDWFAVTAPSDGMLTVKVTPPADVDVVLIRAEKQTVVNRHGPGSEEDVSVAVQAGKPLLIAVGRKAPAGKDGKNQSLQAEDEPYELITSFRPAP